jgi:septum formation protein
MKDADVNLSPFVPQRDGPPLVLASVSPRRAELLRVAGIPFEVRAPRDAEAGTAGRLGHAAPRDYAVALALAKAEAVAADHPGRLVLGADTVVVLDGEVLEKPGSEGEAARMLGRLQGRRHTVITALALLGGAGGPATCAESTEVEFLPLDEASIRRYVATGEPMDKAGAYGIQGYGAMMVRRVEGCYFNVMGLPLARLGALLRAAAGAAVEGGDP